MSDNESVDSHVGTVAKRPRSTIIKFVLAGIAVLGIGAAVTTAAWTGDVWFGGTATAGTLNLEGSTDGTTYAPAPSADAPLTFGLDDLTGLTPGANKTYTLYVKNTGTLTITLTAPVLTVEGAIFAGAQPATAVISTPLDVTTLAPTAVASFVVTVTTPDPWDNTYQGTSGEILIDVTGTSS